MLTRALPLSLLVLMVGVLGGSGLAGLADAPPSDPCLDYGYLPEGSSSSGLLEFLPFGMRCDYHVGSRLARSEFFGPNTAELFAWMAVATLIAALGLLKRDLALARGVAAAAAVLALAGAVWQFAGVSLAFFACVVFGPPLVFALDHLLRPPGMQSFRDSSLVAIAVTTFAFCTMLGVLFAPAPAIATCILGVAVGSLVPAHLQRPDTR